MNCFVIMPFTQSNSDSIYENWIKKAVEEIEFNDTFLKAHRADKTLRPGEIINDLIQNISESEIVIADLTGKNANVFYELGVRHALSNNTILIAQNIDDIPFDLRSQRIIIYQFEPDSMLQLKSKIKDYILTILTSPDPNDNPVRKYLYEKETKKFFEGGRIPGYNLIETMLTEITSLKKDLNVQFKEISSIVENMVSEKSNNSLNTLDDINKGLEFFEGAWYNPISKSHYYAKVVNGKLLIPYCYGGNEDLSAHYHDLKLIGNTLVGKYTWIHQPIFGYFFVTIKSNDELEGGWWYSEHMPTNHVDNYWDARDKIGHMVKSRKVRIKNVDFEDFPIWAKKYFKKYS